MKKNKILYILLIFLVGINAFFLFNYLGGSKHVENKTKPERGGPVGFIVRELGFSEDQMFELDMISRDHHHEMRRIRDDIKGLKDVLFNEISNERSNEVVIDSITTLIGQKIKERDIETFYHFKEVRALCTDEQKEKFKKIINDALHREGRNIQRSQFGGANERHRPPPPRH